MRIGQAWHLNPAFIEVHRQPHSRGAGPLSDAEREHVPVLLTAHSLPKRVVDREPEYVEQLRRPRTLSQARQDCAADRWSFVYQSAGHTPEEWLKPDMLDVLPELADGRAIATWWSRPCSSSPTISKRCTTWTSAGREQAEQAGI